MCPPCPGRCALLFALPGALVGAPLLSQARPSATWHYQVATFSAEQGLPSRAVTSLAQTSDGYLWIATGGILTRFDGHTFQTFTARTTPLLSRRVNSVHAGLGDTLWIVDEGSAVLAFAGGQITEVIPPFNAPIGNVVQSARGLLFATNNDSAWLLREQRQVPDGTAPITRDDLRPEFLPWTDRQGASWLVRPHLDVRGLPISPHLAGSTRPALVVSPSRREAYEVRAAGQLREIVDADGRVVSAYRDSPGAEARLIDAGGRLWVTNHSSIAIHAPASMDPTLHLPELGYQEVQLMLEDRNGCVWTARLALHRSCMVPFRTIGDFSPLERTVTSITTGPRGSVLLLDVAGAVTQAEPAGYRLLEPGFPVGEPVRATFTDLRGTIWFAKDSGIHGLVRGKPEILIRRKGIQRFAGHPQRDDVIWFASGTHLYRMEPYAAGGPRYTDSVRFGAGVVTAMAVTGKEVVWATLKMSDQSPGLLRVEKGEARLLTPRDGLPASALRAVRAEEDGTVWIGTYGAGLVRLRNGRFQVVTEDDGLAEDVVTSILEDEAGNFWMGGNRSIHRVSRSAVVAFLDGHERRVYGAAYGASDGIRDPETSGRSGVRDDVGRLWFPTLGGAVVVEPALALELDSLPPLVHILGIRTPADSIPTDGWSPPQRTPPRLTLGARRLEISFTGISMRNPAALRYEYRIDGLDRSWVVAGGARAAIYNEVPPGTHTFRVRAIGAGGILSATDATLQFIVPAHFFETRAFLALVLATAGALGWLALQTRMGHLRRREAELTQQVEARTQKLGVALQTVAQQADELRVLDQAKSRFFANVSHEFRTPLSLILGPVEDLRDGRAGPLSAAARKRLDNVVNNARRLIQLVEQLLDVARLESGKLHLSAEAQDLIPLVRRMADSFASLAEHRGIAFHLSCTIGAVRVRYDTDHMEKIISNLVGNALKFTPGGGVVQLRVSSEPGNDGVAILEVEDSGPGIAPEHQQRVFERFYQVDDSPRRSHGGVGIGLALVKELVELHGGTIALRSAVGSGSTFTVKLPLAPGTRHSGDWKVPAGTAAAASERVETPAPTPAPELHLDSRDELTVLVVEDNEDLLEFLAERLSERFRVLSAPNGARGLEMAREHVPDLIISDVMMPEMDGQALCEAVKSDPEIDFLPVILLTAKASRDSRLAGLSGGADDYLTKPVDLTELLIRADNLIASRRRVRERYRAEQRELPTMQVAFKAAPRDSSSRAILERFYAVLTDHLGDESFDVDQMAVAMGMGRTTLYRKLEALLGRSPMEALSEYRLAQAAQWLAETSISVSEVAYGVGFKSVPHFCTKFRDRHGETPSGYRRARLTASART